jgi:hypothetical protein
MDVLHFQYIYDTERIKHFVTDYMLDSETLALREKQRLKRLEEQIQDMLLSPTTDHRYIIRELDYTCKYSSPDKLAVVGILYKIKNTGLAAAANMKLQKVLSYYAVEHENVLALKP